MHQANARAAHITHVVTTTHWPCIGPSEESFKDYDEEAMRAGIERGLRAVVGQCRTLGVQQVTLLNATLTHDPLSLTFNATHTH